MSAARSGVIARVASPRFSHPSVTITAGPPRAAGFDAIAPSAFSRLVAPGLQDLHPGALFSVATASLTDDDVVSAPNRIAGSLERIFNRLLIKSISHARIAVVILADASKIAGRVAPSMRMIFSGPAIARTNSASASARISGAKILRNLRTLMRDQTSTAIGTASR